ncbi:MAG: hypothetical protein ACR2QK_04900 [Acidimicrobiales bacterium]
MHPIEQLRYVARASGADGGLLVQEAASALSVFSRDPGAMLTACRRLLTRQPAVGPLWWMCARMVTCGDARSEARSIIDDLHEDRTGRELAHGIPDGSTVAISGWPDITVAALPRRGDVRVLVVDVEGQGASVVRRLDRHDIDAEDVDAAKMAGIVEESDVIVIEAAATGSAAALVDVGSVSLAATAKALRKPVWLVVGVGRNLLEPYWQAIVERVDEPDLPAFLAPHEILSFGLVDRIITTDGPVPVADGVSPDMPLAPELLVELS